MKPQWPTRSIFLLAITMTAMLATLGLAANEPILTTRLDLATTPTLGGQGTVIWCGIADRPISEALLTLNLESGEGTAKQLSKIAPQPLTIAEGKVADATFDFVTPAPGRYCIRARVDWRDGEGPQSKMDSTRQRLPDQDHFQLRHAATQHAWHRPVGQ